MSLWSRITNLVSRQRPAEPRVYMPTMQAGVRVTEDTAMTLAEWWACVSVISRTVAALPWGVYEKTPAGRKEVDGAIGWLLNNQPNPEMTAFSFREALMGHVLNWGNGFAEIQRDLSGRVVALWLITPDRVQIRRSEQTGEVIYCVTGNGDYAELTADKVLHIHGLGFDGLSGYSVVRMAARSIGIGIAQDVFGQSFYANGTVFGAMVEVAANMTPAQIETAEGYLNGKHQGPAKAFGVKIAPGGSKVHQIGMPLSDAQFIESRGMSITMAARWLGVPPHKIADLSRSTNNNIEHQGIEFVTDAIVPWTVRLEQEANVKLFSSRAQGRVYTKLSVNALMRGDSKARSDYYRTMSQIGALTINQILAMEEMNGIGPAGDVHLVQLNQTTLEWLVENPGAKSSTPAPKPGDVADDPLGDGDTPPEKPATNVIRVRALQWLREQRKQA